MKPKTDKRDRDQLENLVQLLFDLVPYTKISHHVPGKITFQYMRSALGLVKHVNLRDMDMRAVGILHAKAKILSRSVTIEYNQDRLPYDLWESLFHIEEEPENKQTLHERLMKMFLPNWRL